MTVQIPRHVRRARVGGSDGDLFRYEMAIRRSGFESVAGIDEAGRGACAGPLVVAAAILDSQSPQCHRALAELNDSKKLSAQSRERVAAQVKQTARAWVTVVIPAQEVDRIGLHVANLQGMRRALARLGQTPDYVLTDGFPVPGLSVPSLGVWKGDEVSACVSAAGVLAKVERDRIMAELDGHWPQYGFAEHKGYVTAMHRQALRSFGPSPVHRFCFAPVRQAFTQQIRSGDSPRATVRGRLPAESARQARTVIDQQEGVA